MEVYTKENPARQIPSRLFPLELLRAQWGVGGWHEDHNFVSADSEIKQKC